MPPGGGFAFGAFHLDLRGRILRRHGAPVVLTPRQFDLLQELVGHAGDVVTKRRLMDVGWTDVHVTENNLVQSVKQLRQLLDPDAPERYIATVARAGYRFVVPVTADTPSDDELDQAMAPHRALTDGRALLETLERARIGQALRLFETLVARDGRNAMFHVGLANACVLAFEATRAEAAPDADALNRAAIHAREARRLDPAYAEAWATYGVVLERTGAARDAVAALGRAVSIEPLSWHHRLRLAWASWGDERLRAAHRTLELWPGLPMAHLLAATVFVARGAFPLAERELAAAMAGAIADQVSPAGSPLVAVHWLHGLLCLARGADEAALAAFERELSLEPRGHLYARECCANAWYAKGAHAWRRGDGGAARAAYREALARVPQHPMATAGLALVDGSNHGRDDDGRPGGVDAAMAYAAVRVPAGDAAGAAALVSAALDAAPPGNAGWLLPVDPLINVSRDPAPWAAAIATVRGRASVRMPPAN